MARGRRRIRHLDPAQVERARAGGIDAARMVVEALRHLADTSCGCPECQEALADYPLDSISERAGGGYRLVDEAARHVRAIDEELGEAEGLLAELREITDLGLVEQHLLSNPRFATLGVGLMLLEYADDAADGHAHEALGLTEIAVCIGESLRERRCGGKRFVQDFRAMARAQLAAAQRRLGRLDDAQVELQRAEAHLKLGTRSRGVEGTVVLERCRWWLAKARPAEAKALATRVETSAERLQEDGQQREALFIIARAKRLSGELLDAITELRVVIAMAREARVPPSVEARYRLELVAALFEAGELEAARVQIARLRMLPSLMSAPHVAARVGWRSGMIEVEAGRPEKAIEELEAAWRALAAEDLGLEAVGAGLALASVYLDADRREDLAKLGEELPELIAIGGLPDWAVGTLLAALGGIWQGDGTGIDRAVGLIVHAASFGWSASREPVRH